MGIRNKVQKLFNQKYKIEKEIGEIQRECHHNGCHLKFTYPNPDSHLTALKWVCDHCEKVLRIPTKKESNDWLRK